MKALYPASSEHASIAVLSFGSNQGDRVQNVEHALRLLETSSCGYVHVVDTSFLYETTPMYVRDQPPFLNGACTLETNLSALDLVSHFKEVEALVDRVQPIGNGPRAMDLDLIFYEAVVETRTSNSSLAAIGHVDPCVLEREFVLRPLNDMIPDYVHPQFGRSISHLLHQVQLDPNMKRILPWPVPSSSNTFHTLPPRTSETWDLPPHSDSDVKVITRLMATLNVTPDSFSDDSDHNGCLAAVAYAKKALTSSNTSLLDIGGYSTIPGATFVSVQEEIDRVVPVIQAIRQGQDWNDPTTPISINTFRPQVARAAILAGATCINDIYAFCGTQPEMQEEVMQEMKALSREFCVPVVLMHARGDAGSNKDYSEYAYGGSMQVVESVRRELGVKVDRIVRGKGGVRRWLIAVDPGVGFGGAVLELLRNASAVTADVRIGPDGSQRNPLTGYPFLIDTSRKSFLGGILQDGVSGKETGTITACAVQQGALIVRVHDIQENADVLKMCNRFM